MGTLARRVKWTAAVVGAGVVATWLFPLVATVLAVALYSSWAVIGVLLLRALPVPQRVTASLPALAGRLQRAAARAWPAPTPAGSWRPPGREPRVRALLPASWLPSKRWYGAGGWRAW